MDAVHQIVPLPPVLEPELNCSSCQTPNPEAAKFCLNCGTPLRAAAAPEGERKLVTALFADVVGSTAMAERLDPEEVTEIMNGVFAFMNAAVSRNGGMVARLMGDAVLALFGAPTAREGDAHRAVRAALQIQSSAEDYAQLVERRFEVPFGVRIGINTGLAVMDVVGDEVRAEYTAMGDAVNLASRLQGSAPPGGVLISHDTYRHIRGLFQVEALEPIHVKGKADPVRIYLVLSALPRTFRDPTRSVAGIETPLVGRDTELNWLQAGLRSVESATPDSARLLGLIADAGVGKSRLIHEFEARLDQEDRARRILRARASEDTASLPYSLIRALFAHEFSIQDSDNEALAKSKLEQGVAEIVGEGGLHSVPFIGQLIGLDYADSPQLRGIRDDSQQIRDRAFHAAGQLFHSLAQAGTTLILLEDIHWSDDGSLDMIEHVAQICSELPLLVVCSSRPSLFERRPSWGENKSLHAHLRLEPLSDRDSSRLIESILRNLPAIPPTLLRLLQTRSEGNPFYIEELVKMLIDDGIILPEPEQWQLNEEHLTEIRMPPTLQGVLQARLDGLPLQQRKMLQVASVVGRTFWDDAVGQVVQSQESEGTEPDSGTEAALAELGAKEMVLPVETSSFAGLGEYAFKHSILWEVTYESLLLRLRRAYHALVADWLHERSGERVGEFSSRIARHFEMAGRPETAADWYARAGKQAQETYAPTSAVQFYEKALDLWGDAAGTDGEIQPRQLEVLQGLGQVLNSLGEYAEAVAIFDRMLATAEAIGDSLSQARAWHGKAEAYMHGGDLRAGVASAVRQEEVAQAKGLDLEVAKALWMRAWGAFRMGDAEAAMPLAERVSEISRQHGDRGQLAHSLNLMGVLYSVSGGYEAAAEHFERALEIFEDMGNRRRAMPLLNNLGVIAESGGDYKTALARYSRALQIARQIGNRDGEMVYLSNLGGVKVLMEDFPSAEADLRRVIEMVGSGGLDVLSTTYKCLAEACLGQGKVEEALEFARRALAVAKQMETKKEIAVALRVLGQVSARRDAPVAADREDEAWDARACFARSEVMLREIGRDDELARTLQVWAKYEVGRGDGGRGRNLWQQARQIFKNIGAEKEVQRMGEAP